MQLRVALIVSSLLVSGTLLGACSSGGSGSRSAFYYAPPVNYQPGAGLTPDLTDARLGNPAAPPFKP